MDRFDGVALLAGTQETHIVADLSELRVSTHKDQENGIN